MKKELKEIIKADLYRYKGIKSEKGFTYFKSIITNRGFKYTVLKRKTQYYKTRNRILYYYYRILLRINSSKYGFQIPYSVEIDRGFSINHWGRIIINEDVIIGKNVSISTGVVLGKEFRGKREGAPIIKNEVFIGANAVVVGKVVIGNNVLIAPNSYINFDVPDNSIVIGNPAKIVSERVEATNGYLFNKV